MVRVRVGADHLVATIDPRSFDDEWVREITPNDCPVVGNDVAIEGGLRGHDGVRRWWQNWLDTWPDYRAEVVEMRDHGDVTIVATRALGHGAGSEVPFEDAAWQVCRWRAGKLAAWSIFTDEDQALEAARLSEQDAHADS